MIVWAFIVYHAPKVLRAVGVAVAVGIIVALLCGSLFAVGSEMLHSDSSAVITYKIVEF